MAGTNPAVVAVFARALTTFSQYLFHLLRFVCQYLGLCRRINRPFSHAHGHVSIEYHYAAARHSDHPDPSEQRQTVRIHHADDHGAGERLARRALLTSSMLLLATSRSSSSAVLCWR